MNELDVIFSQLEPQHMVGDLTMDETITEKGRAQRVADLKRPSEGFLGGDCVFYFSASIVFLSCG